MHAGQRKRRDTLRYFETEPSLMSEEIGVSDAGTFSSAMKICMLKRVVDVRSKLQSEVSRNLNPGIFISQDHVNVFNLCSLTIRLFVGDETPESNDKLSSDSQR